MYILVSSSLQVTLFRLRFSDGSCFSIVLYMLAETMEDLEILRHPKGQVSSNRADKTRG